MCIRDSIRGFTDTETLLKNKVEDQNNIVTVEPKIFMQDGKMVLLMPGDEGYDDH